MPDAAHARLLAPPGQSWLDRRRLLARLASAAVLGAGGVGALAARATAEGTDDADSAATPPTSEGSTRPLALPMPGLRWQRPLPPPYRPLSGPTLMGETVFVVGAEGLVALAAESGELRWTHDLERAPVAGCACLANPSPNAPDGAAYAVTGGNEVLALDIESGRRRWAGRVGALAVTRPVAANGRVYIGAAETLAAGDAAAAFTLLRQR